MDESKTEVITSHSPARDPLIVTSLLCIPTKIVKSNKAACVTALEAAERRDMLSHQRRHHPSDI